MRILLVEDDLAVSKFVSLGFAKEGFAVDTATEGTGGFRLAIGEAYDVIILDVVIPCMDGLELLGRLRKHGSSVPVLILSAKDSVIDRVRALNGGADDYLVKPFSFSELSARVRALLRRRGAIEPSVLHFGKLHVDFAAHKVTRAGRAINLTRKEFALLEYLVRHQGTVVTRTMIAEHVWDQHFDSFSNTIDVYVRYLREKINDGRNDEPKLIHTVRGVGYIFTSEGE